MKMKLFSDNYFRPFLIVLCLLSVIFGSSPLNNSSKTENKMNARKKSVIALLFTTNASLLQPEQDAGKCRWLKGLKTQRKLCQRRKGLSKLLLETRELTLHACKVQFQYEQWNCSTTHTRKFFKKLYRETAFVYSLATSAFVYVVARACSNGSLANCKCGEIERKENSLEKWQGCSVNIKSASKFVEKFLQLKMQGDNPSNIMKYNSQIGIKMMRSKTEEACKCHGISGSCSQRVCWKKLTSFNQIAKDLKLLYHNAIQVESNNNIRYNPKEKRIKQLLYLDQSPNFCDLQHGNRKLSMIGRQCRDIDNCATLCCGNDYTVSTRTFYEKCNCKWKENQILAIKCENCSKVETLYHCL